MDINIFIPRPPITEAVVFDGSEDAELASWCGGDLIPTDEPNVWKIEIPIWGGSYQVSAGEIIFRSENGTMGWTPFMSYPVSTFNQLYMSKPE